MLKAKYLTHKFTEVECITPDKKWDNSQDFVDDWKLSPFYTNGLMGDNSIKLIYALLFAKYGNSHILNKDENQFKYKVWSTIFQYGPTWQKELDIQNFLRQVNLDYTDSQGNVNPIYQGSKMIYNHSFNPSSAPSTSSLNELTTVDDQNTTNYKKSLLEGLNSLEALLKTDVTENFILKFRKLFKQFAMPDYYEWGEMEDEDE